MLDDEPEVLGACLKKLGYSINSGNPAELLAARQEALAQKPLLRAYLNAEVRDQAVAGDVLAAQAWAVTAAQTLLLVLWKTVPRTEIGNLIKLFAYLAALLFMALLSAQGKLYRTRPILPGEVMVE